jgi:hypothetical protein
VQLLTLRAAVLYPRVEFKTEFGQDVCVMDYGSVAVGSSRTKRVVLQNPTCVDAQWSVHARGDDQGQSDFQVSTTAGTLAGAEPERARAREVLSITFCPARAGKCSRVLNVQTPDGHNCTLELNGVATHDEVDEPHRSIMGLH